MRQAFAERLLASTNVSLGVMMLYSTQSIDGNAINCFYKQ
jgi:hypothetical protein